MGKQKLRDDKVLKSRVEPFHKFDREFKVLDWEHPTRYILLVWGQLALLKCLL